jgi:hypothetical protein
MNRFGDLMNDAIRTARRPALPRRLVLTLAVVLALMLASALERPATPAWVSPAVAQAPAQSAPPAPPAAPSATPPPPALPAVPAPSAKPGKADKSKNTASDADTDADTDPDVGVAFKDRKVVVSGLGHRQEYDSFADFVHEAPWIAGLVFLTVLLVFLVPLLVIVLLVWYKMRKSRMLNETMLKLAEKGVVPPAEAMDALAGNRAIDATMKSGAATAPLYEQARALQKRNAWSDLRKGVFLAAIGFALQAASVLDDGTPNGFGIVLLFVGIGYLVLWFLEERHSERRARAGQAPGGGA